MESYDTSNIILNEPSEADIEKLEEMLKSTMEIENKYKETEEYKTLYAQAKLKFPDMEPYLIQMALLSYLENPDIPI